MDDGMNQNNITLTYQQCRSFLQLSTHTRFSCISRAQTRKQQEFLYKKFVRKMQKNFLK